MDPNVLRQCTQRLLDTAEFIRSIGNRQQTIAVSSAPVSTCTATTSVVSTQQATLAQPNSAPSTSPDTVRDEHSRLFGYRPPAPARSTRQQRGNNRGRRFNPYRNSAVGRANSTWSRSFVCLARAGQQTPPTTAERIDLSLNGLGEKKLAFPKGGESCDVHETILSAFAALGGGYEILRAGEGRSKELLQIPMPPSGFSVAYLQSVLGQAKGYLRPLQRDIVLETSHGGTTNSDKDDEPEEASASCPRVTCVNCQELVAMGNMREHQLSCGGGGSSRSADTNRCARREQAGIQQYLASQNNPDQVENLRELFPGVPVTQVESALRAMNGNIDEAASVIMLDNSTVEDDGHDELLVHPWESTSGSGTESLADTLDRMATKLIGLVLRVRIEEDDLLMQALPIYKDPKFDPTRPLNITFKNQPAVDTGGPRREFYTQLFHGIATSDGSVLPAMFEGEEGRLIPCYSSSVVYSGLMTVVGKMIAHSIVQCGVGFPFLSPVCYWYLITGDVSEAISYGNIEDVRDIEYAELIHKLLAANTNDEMSELANDEKTVRLLGDAGCSVLPSVSNQQLLVESLMLHTILSKKKVLLDQLRKGLQVLNVLEEASKRPLLFESLFVGSEENLTPEKLKASLSLPAEDMNEDQIQTMAHFLQFVDESSQEVLKDLLRFATGSMALPSSRKIDVKFDVTDGCIFTSTCTMELRLPVKFDSYKIFEEALKIVISRDEKKSFNAM